jgi:hydroxymethylbilane synthase
MTVPPLRIGTRGSSLALAQASEVKGRLAAAHPHLAAAGAMEIVVIRTSGDKVLDRTLADLGGKGLFTKEIDTALVDGSIDLAVHSVKDMPTWLADGIVLACTLPREDPRDVLVSARAPRIEALPPGAVVGTASLRRQAQVLHRRPDLRVVPLRGNVETRLHKVAEGAVDATLLALAGLRRLGLEGRATTVLEAEELLPAVGQGAVGVVCRAADERMRAALAALDDGETMLCVTAERAMLEALDGSCRTPIAGLASVAADGRVWLRGLAAAPDGSLLAAGQRRGDAGDAAALGRDLGEELRRRAGPVVFGQGGWSG